MKHGPFSNLASLAAVKGLGRVFFQNLLSSDCVLSVRKKKHKLSSLLSDEQKKVGFSGAIAWQFFQFLF